MRRERQPQVGPVHRQLHRPGHSRLRGHLAEIKRRRGGRAGSPGGRGADHVVPGHGDQHPHRDREPAGRRAGTFERDPPSARRRRRPRRLARLRDTALRSQQPEQPAVGVDLRTDGPRAEPAGRDRPALHSQLGRRLHPPARLDQQRRVPAVDLGHQAVGPGKGSVVAAHHPAQHVAGRTGGLVNRRLPGGRARCPPPRRNHAPGARLASQH